MSDDVGFEGAALRTEFPLHSPDFFAGDRYLAYRDLRASAPVCWNEVAKFWALLKYEDIRCVSTNLFTSTEGITIPESAMPNSVQEGNLIVTDPPRHRQLRNLITRDSPGGSWASWSRRCGRSSTEFSPTSGPDPPTNSPTNPWRRCQCG